MGYTSVYPPAYNTTYVKATTELHAAHQATNPSKSLIGIWNGNAWVALNGNPSQQRFHIDLGEAKVVKRIYYENSHFSGGTTNSGANNFTLWGSNSADSFAELTYGTDTGWTQLPTSQSIFDRHVAANQADPKYITVNNSTAYRYYAFKFADNYGNANSMGVRRIEVQEEDEYTATFTEQNSLDDVEISIYSDEAKTTEVDGSPITTAGGGVATIDLPNGTYYHTASKSGYGNEEGDFTITDGTASIDFTMEASGYTVTFTEQNALDSIEISIYSDEAKTVEVTGSPITTAGGGIATIDLANGTYYYTAGIGGYDEKVGSFVVAGAVVGVDFTMVAEALTFTTEKNSLTPSQVIHLYEIEYSSGGNLYWKYFTNYDSDIVFPASGGQTYQKCPVSHSALSSNRDGQVDQVTISVANVDRVIGSYMEECGGFRGRKINVKTVFADLLDDEDAYIQEKCLIDSGSVGEDTCQLMCTSRMDVMNVVIPRNRFLNMCRWQFKSTECGYSGGELLCNKTFTRCRELDNQERYGGFFIDTRTKLWF